MSAYCGADNKQALHEENPEKSTPLQLHYLGLLERLIKLGKGYREAPEREERLLKAISKATYSAYRSCIEHGAEAEARALLKGEPLASKETV